MSENLPAVSSPSEKDLHVVVLCGGTSSEREVSLRSGEAVEAALSSMGLRVTRLDTANRNHLAKLFTGDFDVAFPALHGHLGEDGAIQGMLEVLELPYVGSGIWSSATCMDKERTKDVYRSVGIPTLPSAVLHDACRPSLERASAAVGFRCIVKPADGGSSRGLGRASNIDELEAAVKDALVYTDNVLVEREVEGAALAVGVLGNENLAALPVLENRVQGEHDYEAKIGATDRLTKLCPTPILSDQQAQALQQWALAAHRALGCQGMSRTDFMFTEGGDSWALETNTIPGFTDFSSYPTEAKAAGIEYSDLCLRLVELAMSVKSRNVHTSASPQVTTGFLRSMKTTAH